MRWFFLLAIPMLLISCNKCKNPPFCALSQTANEYFGVYTEGSYWIYLNTDSTLVDSVYIADHEYKTLTILPNCYKIVYIEFTLINNYLYVQPIKSTLSTYGSSCEGTSMNFNMQSPYHLSILFESENPNPIGSPSMPLQQLDTFLLRDDPSLSISDVYIYNNRYWIAPNMGLIQYISYDNVDTFYLDKYSLK